jgi:type 2A phosphatase activator TIP41
MTVNARVVSFVFHNTRHLIDVSLQRIMPSSFLLLLRQFVRVDRVFVRVRDTRFYHKYASTNLANVTHVNNRLVHRFGSDHVIREQLWLEAPTDELESTFDKGDRQARAALYDPTQVC